MFVPFNLIIPEKFARKDIEIELMPLTVEKLNPFSSDGDILVVANFANVLDIERFLSVGYFYLIKRPDRLGTFRLFQTDSKYYFYSTSSIPETVVLCYDELDLIYGQIIMSYHDFSDLSSPDEQKYIRELN